MAIPSFDGPQVTASDTLGTASDPRIVALTGGGVAVAWNGFASGDSDGGQTAHIRLFDAERAAQGPGVSIVADLADADPIAQLAALPNGGFVAAYLSGALSGGGAQTARIVRFDADGAQVGGETGIPVGEFASLIGLQAFDDGRIAALIADTEAPGATITIIGTGGALEVDRKATGFDIASLDAGDRLIDGGAGEVAGLFLEAGTPTSSRDVSLAGYDVDGDQTFSVKVFDDAAGALNYDAARLADGSYVVVALTGGELTAVAVSAAGVASAPVSLGSPDLPDLSFSEVVADPEGGYVVVLGTFDAGAASRSDVFGLKVDAAGAVEGEPFRLNGVSEGFQSVGRGTYDADGDLVVAYADASLDFRSNVVSLQGLDPDAPASVEDDAPRDDGSNDGGSNDGGSNGGGGGRGGPAPVIWRGNNKNNKKNGKAGDDELDGRGGRDRLNGRGGDDELDGGNGADRIKGGAGADDITGGRGRDVLTGGAGRDDFIYGRRDGRDRITDFKTGADDLEITAGAKRFKQLEISQRGDDLHVEFARTRIILEDVDRSDFGRGDVDFV
ncbi:MAG: hypothetical protein AAGI51_00560 [Pseudomonadota bacterium]